MNAEMYKIIFPFDPKKKMYKISQNYILCFTNTRTIIKRTVTGIILEMKFSKFRIEHASSSILGSP